MITYAYTVTEELGIHARPAARIAKMAGTFSSEIQIGSAMQSVSAKDVMAIMGLVLRTGDEVVLSFDGIDEEEACRALGSLLQEFV